jgi:hypothetical protein
MDFMSEFQPIPFRKLFSMVDFLALWRANHPLKTNFTLGLVGDSVGGQMYSAMMCELARNSQVDSLTIDYLDYEFKTVGCLCVS